MDARTVWYEDTLLPKIKNMFWSGIAVTVFACMSGLFFIVKALINAHTLEVERHYETTFVKIGAHKDDISRLEIKIDRMESAVTDSLRDVTDKLDRNYEQIRQRQ